MTARVFFFGCIGQIGHYLYGSELAWATREEGRVLPFTNADFDGRFCPGLRTGRPWSPQMSPESNALVHTGQQRQGEARLSFEKGWSLLGLWDRTVDKRGGSHALFIVEGGPYTFDAFVELAAAAFPNVWARVGAIRVIETRP